MGINRARAFTTKTVNYQESDSIVTLFAKQEGKLSGIAKGARKSDSKFGAAFDLLNLSEIVYYERSSLNFLSEGQVINDWDTLKTSGTVIQSGLQSAQLINLFVEEGQTVPVVFELFRSTLQTLDTVPEHPRRVELGFYIKLLRALGFTPQLSRCGDCGEVVQESATAFFVPSTGGVVCSDCGEFSEISVDPGLRKSLMKLLSLSQNKVVRIGFSPSQINQAFNLLNRFSTYHLQADMKDLPAP